MKLYRYSLYSLAVLWCSSALAVQVTGNVDVQTLSLGESLTYTLTADANLNNDALDIRPLFKDFIIGNLQIAHESTTKTSWTIPLQPVSAGEITIPALKIADGESQPIAITVNDANSNQIANTDQSSQEQTEAPQPVHLLESQISAENAYKDELLTYTVTIAKRADPENRPPVIPQIEGLKIIPVGDPVEDKEIFADHYQETLAYNYIVIPEKTGTLTVPGATLASDNKQVSDEHIIEIKSMPSSFHGTEKEWLPSAGITIEDRWEPQTSYAKTGQPLTRTITLTGINNVSEQLPDIPTPAITDVKVYRDSEKNEQQYQNGMLISKKTIKQVFVPEKNITFVIPAIGLNWWNTISDRAQIASLDERKFMASIIATNTKPIASSAATKKPSSNVEMWRILLPKILFIAGGIIALLTPILAIIWYHRKALRIRYERYQLWKTLKRCCLTNDPLLAYQALLVWASQRCAQPFTCLEQLPFYAQVKAELDELQMACFSVATKEWNGRKLLRRLAHISIVRPKPAQKSATDKFDEFSC